MRGWWVCGGLFAILVSGWVNDALAVDQADSTAAPAAGASAGAAPAGELTPHLGHSRHRHPHGQHHPTVEPGGKRFFTTRSSEALLPLPMEADAFVFAVFGDRTGGPPEGVDVLADAVRDVNLLEPDLVMTVGDLINGYNRTDEWLVQMAEFKAIMNQLLCPWFPVAGNHDVYWRPLNDPARPKNQHDDNYEMHVGPLWYSFQHKQCQFIILYSDEGNATTGEKDFSRPELQRISPEQLAFLREALNRGRDCHHQFVFLHHPRWLAGGYGDDWGKQVHPLLVAAGNVTAVFAGHIHHMRYDPADGIEYVALATVGGGQAAVVPEVGYLHQYHLVTVRKDQVAMAAFPVGEAIDVREITGDFQAEAVRLARLPPTVQGGIRLTGRLRQQVAGGQWTVGVENPTSHLVDYTVVAESPDSRWRAEPDHAHGTLKPGQRHEIRFQAAYPSGPADESFDPIRIVLSREILTKTTRYAIPEVTATVPFMPTTEPPSAAQPNGVLVLDGDGDCVGIAAEKVPLPQGPFTLECWLRAKQFGKRVGLLAKTESSEYGIFVSGGRLDGSVHLGGAYRSVQPPMILEPGQWHHVALVYDETAVVLYLDGQPVGRTEGPSRGQRKINWLPLFIGADPDGAGTPNSFFAGEIDEVCLTRSAKYQGAFTPKRRLNPTDDTVVFFDCDQQVGPFLIDRGPGGHHVRLRGDAHLIEYDSKAP